MVNILSISTGVVSTTVISIAHTVVSIIHSSLQTCRVCSHPVSPNEIDQHLHAVEHPRPARDAIGTPFGTLQLDRRVVNAVPAADRLDLLERTVRIVGAGMDAESNEAMTDGPNVQIVDVEHPGDRRDVAVDTIPVHVGRYLLEEDRNAAANHPDGRVKYDHAK